MNETTTADFSSFASRLSPCALSFFNELLAIARERILLEGPQPEYEASLSGIIERCGAEDGEAIAQAIRDIIGCRVQMKKGDYLYFFPFFTSVAIERGVIRYSLPTELNDALPADSLSTPA